MATYPAGTMYGLLEEIEHTLDADTIDSDYVVSPIDNYLNIESVLAVSEPGEGFDRAADGIIEIDLGLTIYALAGANTELELELSISSTGSIINLGTGVVEVDLLPEILGYGGAYGSFVSSVDVIGTALQEVVGDGVVLSNIKVFGSGFVTVIGDGVVKVSLKTLGTADGSIIATGVVKLDRFRIAGINNSISAEGVIEQTFKVYAIGLQDIIADGEVVINTEDDVAVLSNALIATEEVLVKHRRDDWYGR